MTFKKNFKKIYYYKMSLQRPTTQRVVALSDIHADLEALVVTLRDCAKVIRKKNFQSHQTDDELYRQLELPNVNDSAYIPDLGYEWSGNDTIVVIVGDLIDGARESDSVTKAEGIELAYYPQVEIKLLLFINAINTQARHLNGGIVKVLGNHDYENFKGNEDMVNDYAFTPDRDNECYYQHKDGTWESRKTFFRFGHEGYRLYQETLGMYIIFRVNNLLFVHGQLPTKKFLEREATLLTFETLHALLRQPYTNEVGEKIKLYDDLISDVLWGREYGDPDERHNEKDAEMEERVKSDISAFCGKVCGDINMTIFVGHCQQHLVHQDKSVRSTLAHFCRRNKVAETFDNTEIYTGKPDAKEQHVNKTFGIVTEWEYEPKQNRHIPILVKLDVAVGRGQEYLDDYLALQSGELSELDFFKPRAPTVFEVIGSKMNIVRSTMANMALHIKRDAYMAYKPSPSIYDAQASRKTKKKKKE